MKRFVSPRDFDWVLLMFVLLICVLGVMQIYSATMASKFADVHMHIKQIYWIVGGLASMLLVSLINYEVLLDSVHWMYVVAIISLTTVLVFGQKYLGAKRWIRLPGGIHFQPSEWVKLILILAMAKYFSEMRGRDASLSDVVKAGLLGGIPLLMVLVQPDLGTAMTLGPIALVMLFLAGLKPRLREITPGRTARHVVGDNVGSLQLHPPHILPHDDKAPGGRIDAMNRPALDILIAQPDDRFGLLRGQRQWRAAERGRGERRGARELQYLATVWIYHDHNSPIG